MELFDLHPLFLLIISTEFIVVFTTFVFHMYYKNKGRRFDIMNYFLNIVVVFVLILVVNFIFNELQL